MKINNFFEAIMYQYTLENGSKKHVCPACGRKTFVRVLDNSTGQYLSDNVGRCDRESKCGYQYTAKQYLADNADVIGVLPRKRLDRRYLRQGQAAKNAAQAVYTQSFSRQTPDHLEMTHLLETIGNYDRNSFVQFLNRLFPDDPDAIEAAVSDYKIGTHDGWTSFPVIDRQGRFCKAKLMKFDQATGKRLKDANGRGLISSLQFELKKAGRCKADFQTDKKIFFGDHLTVKYPTLPIAIVESEKTAVIASICRAVFPDMVWLATGSKQSLKPERIARLGRDRRCVLYPDADGYEKWRAIADDAARQGCKVKVSSLIESFGTDTEKAGQADLADYLVREQAMRNDPAIRQAFTELIEERIAIMTIDGQLSETEAEAEILGSGCYRESIQSVTT